MLEVFYNAVLISKNWIGIILLLVVSIYVIATTLGFRINFDEKYFRVLCAFWIVTILISRLVDFFGWS